MTTPAPSVPVPDFASAILVGLPQQLFKQFTSSPQMMLIGALIIGMFAFGIYSNAKKKRKQQEAAAAKRAQTGGSRRRAGTTKRIRNDSADTAEGAVATASVARPSGVSRGASPHPDADVATGIVHKVMWSPAGNLTLVSEDGLLSGIYHEGQHNYPDTKDLGPAGDNTALAEAERQLNEYFAGERVKFNLTLKEDAPTFDRNVWTGISKIPYGDTWTLESLIESVGYKQGSSTYVSAAINRNRFAIVIPSHRITPAKGKGKYVGGTANKDFLLTLEAH